MLHHPFYIDPLLELELQRNSASDSASTARALNVFGAAYCAVCLGAVLIGWLLA